MRLRVEAEQDAGKNNLRITKSILGSSMSRVHRGSTREEPLPVVLRTTESYNI